MKVLILGGDGYLGWPTAMHLASCGHSVTVVDNYLRRDICEMSDSLPLVQPPNLTTRAAVFQKLTGLEIGVEIADLRCSKSMFRIVEAVSPDTIIHYAEQPSAPYSMSGFDAAELTFKNNLTVTFNLIWAVKDLVPECHIIKLGTMGEYGTPNIDIEEGWIDINHNGRSDKFLFPRAAGSLYHTTKVLDTDLLWFYVRTCGLRVTDLMQGPVYGMSTPQCDLDCQLGTSFYYDDVFGTVINRFIVQAVAGVPLTVYGGGGQTRGYLNLLDTLECVRLSLENPPAPGELSIFNQLTETFTVNELAQRVQKAAINLDIDVTIKSIENPRIEKETHYYNPKYTGLLSLGLKPHKLDEETICDMLSRVLLKKDKINTKLIMPRVKWS